LTKKQLDYQFLEIQRSRLIWKIAESDQIAEIMLNSPRYADIQWAKEVEKGAVLRNELTAVVAEMANWPAEERTS
jgi:hypothetical protein